MNTPAFEIISASAGTGKTYTLAKMVPDLIRDGAVHAEKILATTFTNRAADELLSRIRTKLLEGGNAIAARRLALARIGTVNAVCGALVQAYAFELGLSPDLQVIDEAASAELFKSILGDVVSESEHDELAALAVRMSGKSIGPASARQPDEWQVALRKIVDLSRSNGLDGNALQRAKNESLRGINTTFFPEDEIPDLDEQLLVAIEAFENSGQTVSKSLAMRFEAVRQGKPTWADWQGIAKDAAAKKYAAIQGLAATYPRHACLRADMRRQVELVFDLACRALAAYDRLKRENGILDFVDQETHALRLLETPTAQDRLRASFDLVMVDEFQDTSPLELAIFLKLREFCPHCIWVGDQKQAIYGFRDTDPELMNAVIRAVEANGANATVLGESYRSRHALVDFCSTLFTPPFAARMGLPEERVRIAAAAPLREEPPGLGPVVERWTAETEDELAALVRAFLKDATVHVWDYRTVPCVHAVQPRDVAVLCRTNETCAALATALRRANVPVRLATPGVLDSPEGRLILAGLNLWVDAKDGLAAAEIARLMSEPGDEDAWFQTLLKGDATNSMAAESIRKMASQRPGLGLPLVFNAIVELLKVRERLLKWGDFEQRIANVEAVRAHLETHVASVATMGRSATITGFILHLKRLAENGADMGGETCGNAVTVCTWHKSKGLEWPVAVLWDLDSKLKANSMGVKMISPTEVALSNPLAGRWIRYWPNPLSANTKKAILFDFSDQDARAMTERELTETLRLLYVVMTRAKHCLVLAGKADLFDNTSETTLEAITVHGAPFPIGFDTATAVLNGRHYPCGFRHAVATAITPSPALSQGSTVHWYPESADHPAYPPAALQPSAMDGTGKTGEMAVLHGGLTVNLPGGMDRIGNAVHGFLAADRVAYTPGQRLAMAERLLKNWDVTNRLPPQSLLQVGDCLRKWVVQKWPNAIWHREFPLAFRNAAGSLARGTADLVLELTTGVVLIDHKSFLGNQEQTKTRAATYAGQLAAYKLALESATGKPVHGTFVHFHLCGVMVEVLP